MSGFLAKVGSFATGTAAAGNDVAVTGVGFQPKALMFFWSGDTSATDAIGRRSFYRGAGFGISSTSRASFGTQVRDANATVDGGRYPMATEAIAILDYGGSLRGMLDMKSMDADGFTLTIDWQCAASFRIGYLALGGDALTNVALVTHQEKASASGDLAVTGVGFQPDALIMLSNSHTSLAASSLRSHLSIGFAAGTTEVVVAGGTGPEADATILSGSYLYEGEVMARLNATPTTIDGRALVKSMDADGFTLTWANAGTSNYIGTLCLKGGLYKVGTLATRTDGNDIAVTGLGGPLAAALFASHGQAASTQDTAQTQDRLSFGAASSASSRVAMGSISVDNLADSECSSAIEYDSVYVNIKTDHSIDGLMDVKSFDGDGVTCVMDDADPGAAAVAYMLFGPGTFTGTGALAAPAVALAGEGTAGTEEFTGTGAIVAPVSALAATGLETFAATGALAAPAPTLAGTALETFAATGAITAPAATLASTALETFAATGAIAAPAASLASTGAETFDATGAIAAPAAALAATGTEEFIGEGVLTAPVAALAGEGTTEAEEFTGEGAFTAPAPVLAGTGLETFAATGAITAPAPTLAATGAETFTGTGAVEAPAPTLAATGAESFVAAGAIEVPAPVLAATGAETFTGTAALAAPAPTLAATAVETFTGTAAVTAPAPTLAGTSAQTITGAAAIAAPAPTLSGSAVLTFQGAAAVATAAVALSGTGSETFAGVLDMLMAVPTLAADGAVTVTTFTGTGTFTAPAPVLAGSGLETFTGTGAFTAPVSALAGVGLLASQGTLVLSDGAVASIAVTDAALASVAAADAAVALITAVDAAVARVAASDAAVAILSLSDVGVR